MTYSQTLDYLYSRLPMFTKIGASAIKKDLTNTLALCSKIDNPQSKFKSVHIAGTNGKGSTSHMLAAVLQTAGYKTGLYTSPHLKDFRERIRVNGEMIPEIEVIDFVQSQKTTIEEIEPSFFEVTLAMAFDYFARQNVDIAIIETGLGGRLDSTNVISPILSIITNIGYDHTNILGNTLPEIAFEKAGIIKPNTPVIISEKQTEVTAVFQQKASETDSELIYASEAWEIEDAKLQLNEQSTELGKRFLEVEVRPVANNEFTPLHLSLDLTGSYQLKNIKGVLSSIAALNKRGFNVSAENIQAALRQVKDLTGLTGRWQTLSTQPLVICDTGHNEDGIKEVLKNIAATPFKKLHIVLGMVKDKDITKVLSLLPNYAQYYFCGPQLERAKPAAELANEAAAVGLKGSVYESVKHALESAKKDAGTEDLIFVGGSTFVVAEIV